MTRTALRAMGRTTRRRPIASLGALLGTLGLLTFLAACAPSDPGITPSYESADGTVAQYAPESRSEPIVFGGTSDTGDTIESADYLGSVLVVNFWYAGCAPCRQEAPWLQSVSQDYAESGVSMLGVNVLDDAATSRGFADTFGVTYPSLLDKDGTIVVQFEGYASLTAVPTTVVLDREGRPAARIVGLIDEAMLRSLIDDVLAEASP